MATPTRDNPKTGEEELMCGGCGEWFIPRDGTINVVRVGAEDPGTVLCSECINNLASHNVIERDTEEFKCTCQSMDPSRKACPLHFTLNELNLN